MHIHVPGVAVFGDGVIGIIEITIMMTGTLLRLNTTVPLEMKNIIQYMTYTTP